MEPDPLDPPDPQRQQPPLVLESAVLPLDRAAQPVELLPTQRLAGDQGVQPAGRDPLAGRGAFAGWAAPLGRLPLGVRPGERPGAVLASGRQVLAGLDGGGLAQGDDRVAAVAVSTRQASGRPVVTQTTWWSL